MDGLIPMVYKSLKRSKTRRHYQSLSPSSAASITHTYNISDFYTKNETHLRREFDDQYVNKESTLSGAHHRRYNSAHVVDGRGFDLEKVDYAAAKPKQLVRFRSHRLFSCVTGA
ncbi:hypothetical protein CASFOL_012970 [Castilleja foliolosa]|uniref:Uncharacterized protein n=1 Tax=Castilleja foliolosa TaxID=1961234 RepID=A0ABD3DIM6_9LAMI